MYNIKKFPFFLIVLLTLMFVSVGSVFGAEPSESDFLMKGQYRLANAEMQIYSTDQGALTSQEKVSEEALYLAQAETSEEGEDKSMSPECKAFAKDKDADLGDVIRAGCKPTLAQMSALMDNPLGNVAMLFTQLDNYQLENNAFPGTKENKTVYTGIAQFPKGLGENWNLINRVVWQVVSTPIDEDRVNNLGDFTSQPIPPKGFSGAPIDILKGRTTGFGDLYYVGLFAPKKGKKFEGGGSFLWGAGFDLGFPTASSDVLGTGKYTAGPSGLGVYMGPKWKIGGLVQQYWDYAGDDDRSDVNLMNFQYFIYYSLSDTFSIGAAPNIIANWEENSSNAWTVPIGIGFNTTVNIGKVPVRFGVELHYSVVTPDVIPAPQWDFRFFVIPAAPSALFKWMQ